MREHNVLSEFPDGTPAVLPTIGIAVFLKQFGISRYLGPGNESSLLNLAHVEPERAVNTKQTSGTTKPVRMECTSAMWPTNGAAIAPPTMDMTMRDEPS